MKNLPKKQNNELEEKEIKTDNLKKHFKNLFLIILGIVIIKWIILSIPSTPQNTISIQTNKPKLKQFQEISLNVDFKELEPIIEKKFQQAQNDIENYKIKKLDEYKIGAYSRVDKFLEWLFNYFNGYKILAHKVGGWLGVSKTDTEYIKNKFEKKVVKKDILKSYLADIDKYTQNRIKDFYQDVFIIIQDYINEKIKTLKSQGITNIKIDTNSIPYAKYITASIIDGYFVYEGIGAAMGAYAGGKAVTSKIAASKASSIAGSKIGSMMGAKMSAFLASKAGAVALDVATFGIGVLFDVGANEAVKHLQWEKTKKNFRKIIDNYIDNISIEIENSYNESLYDIKNSVIKELNKQTTIKGIK